jgi:PAS domain S-box-containing protein
MVEKQSKNQMVVLWLKHLFRFPSNPVVRYSLPFLLAAGFIILRMQIQALGPFILPTAIVFLAGIVGGLGPGLLATLLVAVASVYFFILPRGEVVTQDIVGISSFVVIGCIINLVLWSLNRANRRAQEAAHQAAEREHRAIENYRKIYENAVEGIFQTTPDGRLVSANPALAHICGYDSPEEIIEAINKVGQRSVYVDPATRDEFIRLINEQGSVHGFESQIYRKDGSIIWTRENARPVRNEAGEIILYEGSIEDITQRKQFEKELMESEERFKHSFDSAPIGIALIDPQTMRYIRVNRSYVQLLGYSEEELLQRTPSDITHQEDKLRDEARAQLLVRGDIPRYVSEKRYIKKDGDIIWVELTATVVRDDDDNIQYALGMIQDITERKKSAEELQKANNYLAALHETTLALINRLEVKELLSGILRRAGEMLDSPHGLIYIVDAKEQVLRLEYGTGLFEPRVGGKMEKGQGLAGKIWQTGEPMVVADYDTWVGRSASVPNGIYKTIAGAPIKSGGQVTGVILIAYRDAGQVFDHHKVEVLARLAELASVALDNAQLYMSTQRLAAVVESSSDAIYSINLDGNIESWNPEAERLYGYFEEEVLGRSLKIIIPEELHSELTMFTEAIKRGEKLLRVESKRRRKDGAIIDVNVNVSPTKDLAGQVIGGSIISRDITESKAAQEALIEGERALREAQRIARVGSWEWDLASDKLHWSDEMYRIYGVDPATERIDYQMISDLTHPNDREQSTLQTQQSIATAEPFDYDFRIIRKDGIYSILHAQGQPTTDETGKVIKLTGTIQDVTEQRLSEEITRYNEEKLRLLIEGVQDYAIFMLDPEGRITSWSSGAERITGYHEGEVIGRHLSMFYTPEDKARNWAERELELAAKEGKYEEEGWRIRKNGEKYWANIIISPLYDSDGGLRGFSKVTRDETERRKLEQMKSDFISMVSHQLKTPLAIIRGYADNLLLGITGPLTDRQTQYLEEMREISNRYYSLIARLLSVSRVERGTVPIEKRPTELKAIVEHVVANHHHRIDQKGLELRVDGLEEPILVDADFEKTSEAISNIIDNAVKFTTQGGINILAGTDGEYGWLEVGDSGPGVPADVLPKLFKRDQILSGAPHAEGGTGLGLYIAKEFMTLQGGDISVESQEGRGTKFTFTLPLAKVEIESEASHG